MKTLLPESYRSLGLVRFLSRVPETRPRENWAKIARRLNATLLGNLSNRRRFRSFHQRIVAGDSGYFYVIAVPGTLHYLLMSLRLVQDKVRVILIDNGLSRWERAFLAERFPHIAMFRLHTLPASLCAHGDVLNLFFEVTESDFGILDHDTFVFDPLILADPRFAADEFVTAAWCYRNTTNGLPSPRTYLLQFHTSVIKYVMSAYGVGMQVYQWLPNRLWLRLKEIGFGPGNFPKDYVKGFDATNLVSALCLADGFHARCLDLEDRAAVHLGGTSYRADIVRTYLALRFLEACGEPDLSATYAPHFAPFRTSVEALAQVPVQQRGALAGWTEALVARIRDQIK